MCLEKPLEFLEKYPISIEAKELLSQLLVVNPAKRINAKKLYKVLVQKIWIY